MMFLPGFVRTLWCAVLLTAAQTAMAVERITPAMVNAALERQGYTVQSSTRTLLGRVRIIAARGAVWREIVLDASTGQILRDYAVEFTPNEVPSPPAGDMPRGGDLLSFPPDLFLQN